MITVDIKILILVTLLFVMFTYIYLTGDQINEHMDNNEAIANIASIYNEQLAKFDNLTISKDIITGSVSTPVLKSPTSVNVTTPFVIGNKLCAGNADTCIDAQKLAPFLRAWQSPYIYSIKPTDYVVYNDIFDALTKKIIEKSGVPDLWDEKSFVSKPWPDTGTRRYKILDIGVGKTPDDGIGVKVPQGMSVIWLRVLNDRWTALTVKGNPVNIINTTGYRSTIKMKPDGAEDGGVLHRWVPYAVPGEGTYYVSGTNNGRYKYMGNWISGVGFSTNPYNHAMSSGFTYYHGRNGGSGIESAGSSWPGSDGTATDGGDNVAYIPAGGKTAKLMVPVVNSGADKMLYLLDTGQQHVSAYVRQCKVTVNGTLVDSFFPHDNVFSRYYNSRQNLSYLGTRIPTDLIKAEKSSVTLLTVEIDASAMSGIDHVYFREVGTHDY
jgi:hypothetical protein